MAYIAPPSFVNGNVLTAAQLNALSAAIAELQSAGEQPSAAWPQPALTEAGEMRAWMRHQHRYLWWRLDFLPASSENYLRIDIVHADGSVHELFHKDTGTKAGAYARVEDLNGLLTDGEFYTLLVTVTFSSPGTARWMYCQERSAAT